MSVGSSWFGVRRVGSGWGNPPGEAERLPGETQVDVTLTRDFRNYGTGERSDKISPENKRCFLTVPEGELPWARYPSHATSLDLGANKHCSISSAITCLHFSPKVSLRSVIYCQCRTADGTIIEVFEWISQEAHRRRPTPIRWSSTSGKKFEAVCVYETPSNLSEFQNMFAHFEAI